MKRTRAFPKATRAVVAVAAMGGLTGGAIALTGAAAGAASLTNVHLSVSNNAASEATVHNTATYTWDFTTKTAATLQNVTFTVPSTTTGATLHVLSPMYGLGSCTATTVGLSAGTVTVKLAGCGTVPATTPVYLAVDGFTNGTTTGTFKTVVTTYSGAVTASNKVDTGQAATGVTFQSNKTTVTVIVPDSLTFTNLGPAAITLLPVPGVPAVASAATVVNLRVSTNAHTGYDLSGCLVNPLKKTGTTATNKITSASNSAVAPLPSASGTSAFAARVTKATTATTAPGSAGFSLNGTWASTATQTTTYLGYASSCATTHSATPTATNKIISKDTGPTKGDQIALTNGVGISATQAAGTYSGTITYTVTPKY